jgi:hypothetical protein
MSLSLAITAIVTDAYSVVAGATSAGVTAASP